MIEWTDEMIVRLTALWAEGLSTAEIGRRMALSKNAVVGKAHRLNLSARPSPIRKDGPQQPQKSRRTTGATLMPLASAREFATDMPTPAVAQSPGVEAPALKTLFKARPAAQCQWPTSNGKPWLFCGAEAAADRPYCSAHAALAFVRTKPFLAIEPQPLRMLADEMQIDGAKTTPLTQLLAEVNRRRSARGQSEFYLPGMPELRPKFGAAANV